MAFTYLGGGQKRWIGLSTDPKPAATESAPIPVGSTALEADTGRIFRWDGHGWQYGDPETDAVAALLGSILYELVRLRRATEISADIDPDEPAG